MDYQYENTKAGFRFEFFRPLGHVHDHEQLSETQKAVYYLVKENHNLTAKEIAVGIGKSTKTVYRALSRLKETGYIERVGGDYNGSWEVIKDML